ncbi:MAG: hypothetical protein CMM50_10070 [Rhodospirillaceae bacterium]|nr:hypothetical protein [Rhodospirillaceae bacterium]
MKRSVLIRPMRMAALAVVTGALAIPAVSAMPLESFGSDSPGIQLNSRGQLEIKEVTEDASEMDMRLTQQIMVLQQQINQLNAEIQALRAAQQAGK